MQTTCKLSVVVFLISFLFAGCSGSKSIPKSQQQTEEPAANWKSPMFDFDNYASLSAPSMKIPMQKQPQNPAQFAALYVLDSLSRRDDHPVQMPESAPDTVRVAVVPDIDLTLRVLVVFKEHHTDSKRFLMKMYPYSRKWILTEIGVQYQCKPGHGHHNWAKTGCIYNR